MGSLRNNGGGWPPDGGGAPDDLPELPPDWDVVIPDDPAELADEAAAVRAQLRAEGHITEPVPSRGAPAGLRGPLVIMAVAVLVTLASLLTTAWPGPARPADAVRTPGTRQDRPPAGLPALELISDTGDQVPLRGRLPAVILLVDECRCDQLIKETAAAAQPETFVLTVVTTTTPPSAAGRPATPPAAGARPVLRLTDPVGELRKSLNLPPPNGTAAVVLVSGRGDVVDTVPRTLSVQDFRTGLARL